VFLQTEAVAFEDLLPRLAAIAGEGYDRRIFIRADQTADYGIVMQVMARVNAAGYRNLGLVTDPVAQ
jgi:biopolymer transport protein TolR